MNDGDDERFVQRQSQSLSTSHSTKVECEVIERMVTVTYRAGGVDVICRHNHGGFCEEEEEDCYILRSHERGQAAEARAATARISTQVDEDDFDDDKLLEDEDEDEDEDGYF